MHLTWLVNLLCIGSQGFLVPSHECFQFDAGEACLGLVVCNTCERPLLPIASVARGSIFAPRFQLLIRLAGPEGAAPQAGNWHESRRALALGC